MDQKKLEKMLSDPSFLWSLSLYKKPKAFIHSKDIDDQNIIQLDWSTTGYT